MTKDAIVEGGVLQHWNKVDAIEPVHRIWGRVFAANFPIWGPFANLFPIWGRFETYSAMVLFCTWFSWIVHGNRKLQWRVREHRTRGYSNPLLVLAISGEGTSRQRCWRFQGCAEIAALTGDFQGLRVGCRERGTEAISEALHGAAAAEQGVANGNCDLVRKPPAVLAICIR